MLYRCYKETGERFINDKKGKIISKRQSIENTVMESIVPISKAEIADVLPDVSIATIEIVLWDFTKKKDWYIQKRKIHKKQQ